MPTGFTPCWPLLEVQSKDLTGLGLTTFVFDILSMILITVIDLFRNFSQASAWPCFDSVCTYMRGIQNRVHHPCLCVCEWNRGSGWRACSSPGTTCGVALQEIELTVDVVVWLCIAAAEYVNQWVGYGDKFLFIFFFDVTGWTCCVGNMNHAIKL